MGKGHTHLHDKRDKRENKNRKNFCVSNLERSTILRRRFGDKLYNRAYVYVFVAKKSSLKL